MAIQYICNNLQRKTKIREDVAGLNGIDYLEVYDSQVETDSDRQKKLYLHFVLPDFDNNLENIGIENIRIEGGSRVKDIRVEEVIFDLTKPDMLEVDVDRYGDFSIYTLRIVKGGGDNSPPDWIDPILSTVDFSFKVACPSDFDCQQVTECPPQTLPEPEIDYLAKDYASFRQLMLDRLANIIPDWQERNPSDIGMAAIEVLAYAGDHLSYFQDAVATEAYLDTARRRVSMRRHARLLDYAMHEGCNARTWVVFDATETAEAYTVPAHMPLLTEGPRPDVSELDLTPESDTDPIYNVEFEDFVLFASETVVLDNSVQIHMGHIGANKPVPNSKNKKHKHKHKKKDKYDHSVVINSKVNMPNQDSMVFGDKVKISAGANVANVAYASELDNEGNITGNIYPSVSFPILGELPVVPEFKKGKKDVKVEYQASIELEEGSYDDLEVGHNAQVTFTGGTYNFHCWEIGRHVKLIFKADTEIRIDRKLETDSHVHINQNANGDETSPSKVVIYVRPCDDKHHHHTKEVEFGARNHINAHVYAPDMEICFKDHVRASGLFYGRSIIAGKHGQFRIDESQFKFKAIDEFRICIPNIDKGMHVFETMYPLTLSHNYNSIDFYTWGDDDCCLPKGATRASLNNEGNRLAKLKAGDILLFEETLGLNGRPDDADTSHRHVVRLTRVTKVKDPLYEEEVPYMEGGIEVKALRVLNIEWALEDALPFPLCLKRVVADEGGVLGATLAVSIARGNVVLADHGRTICQEALVPASVPPFGERYRPRLNRSEPTFHVPYIDEQVRTKPATGLLIQNPRESVPDIQVEASNNESWVPQRDLLNTDRFATEFVMEMEDDGRAFLRFGDNVLGKRPAPGLDFTATYRVGNGSAGNIGAESLKHLILPAQFRELENHINLRNPIAAQGGTNPEPIEQVRLYAPQAFRTQKRAVTPSDYAQMAETHSEVQKAVANQRWTGSWHTVFITIDRIGGLEVDNDFEKKIRDYLEPFRMMGHELEIEAPRQVALDVAFRVCVRQEFLKSKVKEALLEVFSNQPLIQGGSGFFHPDNFTFGQSVYLSRLVAVAMQVAGVTWVDPLRFQRWGTAVTSKFTDIEELKMGRLEIARLDNNPNAPENGKIEFIMEGGL